MGASNPTYAELDCRQRTPKLEFQVYVYRGVYPADWVSEQNRAFSGEERIATIQDEMLLST